MDFFRWLTEKGVKLASERKQRILSKELISVEVVAEIAPFTHSLKHGGEEIKASAIAYVSYLPDKVFELLDQNSGII